MMLPAFCVFAFCFIANSIVIGPQADGPDQIAEFMMSSPDDANVQIEGCKQIRGKISKAPGDEPKAANAFRAIGMAMEKHLANPQVFVTCGGTLETITTFLHDLTMAMHKASPNIMSTLYKGLRFYMDGPAWVLSAMLENVAGFSASTPCGPELSPVVDRMGGFDILFEALDKWKSDGFVQMSAWRGFSDHSHNPYGAAVIANHGGPNKGMGWMMEQMRIHPEPHFAECADTLSLKYEILQLVNGFLDHDDNNTYGEAFIKEGLLDQVDHTMQVEHDLRGSVSISCEVMSKLLKHNPDIKSKLVGPPYYHVDRLINALKEFHDDDPTPWAQGTFGQSYPVIPFCVGVMWQLYDEIKSLPTKTEVVNTLLSVRPEFQLFAKPLAIKLNYSGF